MYFQQNRFCPILSPKILHVGWSISSKFIENLDLILEFVSHMSEMRTKINGYQL